jgi:hypothetical protein
MSALSLQDGQSDCRHVFNGRPHTRARPEIKIEKRNVKAKTALPARMSQAGQCRAEGCVTGLKQIKALKATKSAPGGNQVAASS